ncbi:MAG TPA: DUF456 domain-containing protein [Acidimicrobiia bacterium]|nr:DUF456 domain-containing protein [Acidimicrobiia bacterium]
MELHDLLAGLAVLIGLIGIVVVFLPGLVLQVIAVTIWAFEESTAVAWVVLGIVIALALTATALKYAFPHRQLRSEGVPGWVLFTAVLVAVVGLFVIPVVGAPIGFILTVYVFERIRRGREQAWPSTKTAVKAVLTSTGIELAGGFLILIVFVAGAFLT